MEKLRVNASIKRPKPIRPKKRMTRPRKKPQPRPRPKRARAPRFRQVNAQVPIANLVSFHNSKAGYTYSAGKGGKSIVVSGADYLTQVSVPAGGANGTVLVNLLLNPYTLAGSRLAAFAGLFDRYDPVHFCVNYEPSVPTTQSGQLLMYIDRDAENSPGAVGFVGGTTLIQRGVSQLDATTVSAYAATSTSYKRSDDRNRHTNFYCQPGGEINGSFFGRLIVATSSAIGNVGTLSLGTLYIKYRFEFYIDQIAPPLSAQGSLTRWLPPVTASSLDLISYTNTLATTTGSVIQPVKDGVGAYYLDHSSAAPGTLFQICSSVGKAAGIAVQWAGSITTGLQQLYSIANAELPATSAFFKAVYRVLDPSNARLYHRIQHLNAGNTSFVPAITYQPQVTVEDVSDTLLRDQIPNEVVIEPDGSYTYPIELESSSDDEIPVAKMKKPSGRS